MPNAPFDAVLIVSFGGPQGLADVRPFLHNVLRGRRIPPARIEEVARHYDLFGGVSPLTEITMQQAAGLRERLAARGLPLAVFVGMRNWHPYLADTLKTMSEAGIRRAIGFIAAPYRSYSSCEQYRQNVQDAIEEVVAAGRRPLSVTYVGDWHTHPGFIAANADHVRSALASLPETVRGRARIVFTAHSLPLSMPGVPRYRAQLEETAALTAEAVGAPTPPTLVFQSRSGRPEDPWLEPDVCDYLRSERGNGRLEAVVLAPIGFLCDHIEVLYDLDHDAAAVCQELGLPMARASTVNTHPRFLDMMAEVVQETFDRYAGGRPLAQLAARPGGHTAT